MAPRGFHLHLVMTIEHEHHSHVAGQVGRLGAVYQKLGSQLGHKKEKREITVWFVGGALALMGLGAAASLGLFGRVV